MPKVDGDRFVKLITDAPLIAFQRLEYGWAIAAPGEAYYAPVNHPGGGNLSNDDRVLGGGIVHRIGGAFLMRAGKPALRTLRPTAKPLVSVALQNYLSMIAGGEILGFDDAFKKASGDDPAIVDFATQVVIQAIEEHGRPDLQATMGTLKRDMTAEALDLLIEHAEAARELCDREDPQLMLIRMHVMQSVQAMKSVLEMMLRP